MSSWSWPVRLLPLAPSTPTTRNGMFLTRTILSTGSSVSKKGLRDGRPEQADPGGRSHRGVLEEGSRPDVPRADTGKVGPHSQDDGSPVHVPRDDLAAGSKNGRDVGHGGALVPYGGDVVFRQRQLVREDSGAALGRNPRVDDQEVRAERRDRALDRGLRAFADARHGHDGRDADDDPERGQPGAQLVPCKGLHRDAEQNAEAHVSHRARGPRDSTSRRMAPRMWRWKAWQTAASMRPHSQRGRSGLTYSVSSPIRVDPSGSSRRV